ncbi:MAG: signal peptidase I [Treponema sp.]|nr:signal peptidase I [Treponema sp.]
MNKELYELSYALKKDLQRKIFVIILFLLGIFLSINLILAYLVFPLRQVSTSMQPDINRSSCILFTPLDKNISRGDVVLLSERNPDLKKSKLVNNLNKLVSFFTARQVSLLNLQSRMGNECQIRRVIGIPGDELYMRDYVMYIKPKGEKYFLTEFELVKKPYNTEINAAPALWDMTVGVSGTFDTITLKDNEYFVLGDSRNSAVDSRLWGPVSSKNVKASAILQYFPLNKFKFF